MRCGNSVRSVGVKNNFILRLYGVPGSKDNDDEDDNDDGNNNDDNNNNRQGTLICACTKISREES